MAKEKTTSEFDVVVIGAGPGGYIAAIRAAQLGSKVVIIESQHLGGVCLNKGCIPTKAVLKSAHSVHEIENFKSLGIEVELKSLDGGQAVKRANEIAKNMAKGVGFLMKKNKIEVIDGKAQFETPHEISVETSSGEMKSVRGKNFIIATGAKYRTFPGLEHDGDRLLGAWEAIKLEEIPSSVGIIGAGAIGVEFAYFWNAFGVDVHIFEKMDRLLPIEDLDSSKELQKYYKKYGIKMSLGVDEVSASNEGKHAQVVVSKDGKEEKLKFDRVLIAVGMEGATENVGLEKIGIEIERSFVKVNPVYQTNLNHIYAIGDVCGPPLLAHAASHEGCVAAEHINGKDPHPIDPLNIPGCTYCQPQVASVGKTEQALKKEGAKYSVGKLPFTANGKAIASNEKEGFVKVLLGEHGELLGAHIVGAQATEMIHEYTLMRTIEGTDEEIFATVHPHPTLGEWLAEAVMAARGRALNF